MCFFDHFHLVRDETYVFRDYLQKGKKVVEAPLTVDHFGPGTLAIGIAIAPRCFDIIIRIIGTGDKFAL